MLDRLSALVWCMLVWCIAALAAPACASPASFPPIRTAADPPTSSPSVDIPVAAALCTSALQSEACTPQARTFTQREWMLPNGVHVTLTPFKTDDKATVRLVFEVGTADETRAEAGLTRVFANWMTRATRAPGAVTFSSEVTPDALILDAEVNPSVVPDAIARLHVLVDDAVALTSNPAPSQGFETRFHAARSVVADSPTHLAGHAGARQALQSVIFQEKTYGRPDATAEQVQSYTPADLKSFVQRHLTPKQTHLYIVGSFRPGDAETAAQMHLGAWTAASSAPPRPVTPVADASLQIFERPGAEEATLAVGTPVPRPGHEDAAALQVATVLIGGGHASRLAQTQNVPFTSSPYSLIAAHRDASYWAAVASTRATHTQPVLQTVRRILGDLRSSAPDTAAVEHAQIVLIDRFLLQSSTRDGLAEQLMFLHRHDLSTDYFMTYRERILSVTPGDVQRVVNTYLSPGRLTTIATGPKLLLQPQLAPFRERMP